MITSSSLTSLFNRRRPHLHNHHPRSPSSSLFSIIILLVVDDFFFNSFLFAAVFFLRIIVIISLASSSSSTSSSPSSSSSPSVSPSLIAVAVDRVCKILLIHYRRFRPLHLLFRSRNCPSSSNSPLSSISLFILLLPHQLPGSRLLLLHLLHLIIEFSVIFRLFYLSKL